MATTEMKLRSRSYEENEVGPEKGIIRDQDKAKWIEL